MKSYNIQLTVLLSIVLQHFRTSLNITWKIFLSQTFLFLTYSPKPNPLNGQNLLPFCTYFLKGAGWIKCIRKKIINDLEGFFPKVCSLTPPSIKHKRVSVTIVCTLPPFWGWGGVGVEPRTKFSKGRGVWEGFNFWRVFARKKGGAFFQGGCTFYIKNKLK